MEIMWKESGRGACIYRVFGRSQELSLPGEVEGIPVTEIGPYCFSASERYPSEYNITVIDEEDGRSLHRIENSTMPSISGSYVERIALPETVTSLQNAAFYNCRKLRSLSVGSKIDAIGSDEFMNCVKLQEIIVRCHSDQANGLGLILERLTTDVTVHFCPQQRECGLFYPEQKECSLFFPEYYEWLNEITPAHIFSRSIEGEGLRMRKVFQDRRINMGKYDQCFPRILIGETDANICRVAMNRLRWPQGLSEEARENYQKAVRERYGDVLKILVKSRDFQGIQFLCETFDPKQGELSAWMEFCIDADWSEASAYLMEEKHRRGSFGEKKFDFDDFDDFDDF